MNVIGKRFVGGERVSYPGNTVSSFDAATGEPLPIHFIKPVKPTCLPAPGLQQVFLRTAKGILGFQM